MRLRLAFAPLLVLLATGACGKAAPAPDRTPPAASATAVTAVPSAVIEDLAPAAGAAARGSLYDLQAPLRDENDERVGLDVYRGHPVVVAMFYGTCPHACPMLVSDVKRLEASLDPTTRADVRFLLVSLDPERDTPETLHKVADLRKLDTQRWKLASVPAENVREIAAALGVKYKKLDDGEFHHSSVVTLLDRDGNLAMRVEGLGEDVSPMTAKLTTLAKGRHGS